MNFKKTSSIHLSEWVFLLLCMLLNSVRNHDSCCQGLPPICGIYEKAFRELRTLCVQAQLAVTAEVKRCFRSQRAVRPSSASTKYCLCWGYFQTSCAGVLLRRRAFPPGMSPCCCPNITCMVKSYFNDYKNTATSFNNVFLKDHCESVIHEQLVNNFLCLHFEVKCFCKPLLCKVLQISALACQL